MVRILNKDFGGGSYADNFSGIVQFDLSYVNKSMLHGLNQSFISVF